MLLPRFQGSCYCIEVRADGDVPGIMSKLVVYFFQAIKVKVGVSYNRFGPSTEKRDTYVSLEVATVPQDAERLPVSIGLQRFPQLSKAESSLVSYVYTHFFPAQNEAER